ncbi:SCO family protein [Oceanobacillus luteolus]|uniref:SCO family protein n=1 Tax=Oceanobacillus luteolus TaxID=1274358 RepID=A0ABW4HRK8_9BACI|nr:SCO family protein [Oceanobacillus luteolus]MCM3739872.1 SCO family protein [Oceanobacillus luteolus]
MKRLLLFVALSLFLVGCGEAIETNMNEDMIDFEFTNQDNEPFSLEDLKGNYWIADMVFTNCTTVCLPMTYNMKTLQDSLAEEGFDDIQLVSFTVDPNYDTPEVLKEYGESYEADFSNWNFLTGYDFDTIKEISIKNFKSPLIEAPEESDQVTHGTRFYLVNPEGTVIKHYDGVKSESMDTILNDIKKIYND